MSLLDIKRRVKSVRSTQKITRAMEMVAGSKMRKAQNAALAGRPYALELEHLIQDLTNYTKGQLEHPFFKSKEDSKPRKILFVLFTTDRGLCGGFNSNVIRHLMQRELAKETEKAVICVGQKGFNFLKHTGVEVIADFANFGDKPGFLATTPITRLIREEFFRFSEVRLIYNHFVNTMTQQVTEKTVLPFRFNLGQTAITPREFIFEPSPQLVLNRLLPRYLETIIYQTLLESIASEQSARMVAMKSATENAGELIDTLTLEFNKARQANITTEISEITGGAEALKN